MTSPTELRKLAEAATPGPWVATRDFIDVKGTPENFAFIAAACNSIVPLLDRVEKLEKALEKIIEMNVQYAIDRFGDAAMAETMSCVFVARAALGDK
jgi:hypothetical protein